MTHRRPVKILALNYLRGSVPLRKEDAGLNRSKWRKTSISSEFPRYLTRFFELGSSRRFAVTIMAAPPTSETKPIIPINGLTL